MFLVLYNVFTGREKLEEAVDMRRVMGHGRIRTG